MEVKCCGEIIWKVVECVEKLIDIGCIVSNNIVIVIVFKKD